MVSEAFFIYQEGGERLYIDFDGAMAHAKVWLNGRYVGTWPYGYNSFRMDLTPYVGEGENVLAVRLDTENWESRWYSGAGIYRHVWLVRCRLVHAAHWGTYITTPEVSDQKALVRNEITIENYKQLPVEARLVTRFYELGADDVAGKCVAEKNSTVKIHACSYEKAVVEVDIANPKRWDITAPARYLARTQVYVGDELTDTYHTSFGIRTIDFSASDGSALAFVSLSICDKNGLVVPRSNPQICFSVEGAGEIVSTDNGNAIDFIPFQSHERRAYNGHALVIVKAKKGQTGKMVVKAESEDLKAGSVELMSK